MNNGNNKTHPRIGDRMKDGTILAGNSPDTGTAIYATPADAPFTYTLIEAREYAAELNVHGHKDWRVPTKGELNVLWENRNKGKLKRTFNETGEYFAGWYASSYWTSPRSYDRAAPIWAQRFSDGRYVNDGGHGLGYSSLRCVRG